MRKLTEKPLPLPLQPSSRLHVFSSAQLSWSVAQLTLTKIRKNEFIYQSTLPMRLMCINHFYKKLLILCRWMCGKLMWFITWRKIRAAHFLALAKLFLCVSWRLSSFINIYGHSCHKYRVTCTVIGPIVLFYLTFW